MSDFQIIKPTIVTDSLLTSSSVLENDYAEWAASPTTYVTGDRVISTSTHKIYEALQDVPIDQNPVDAPESGPDVYYWLEVGATNRWRAFDQLIGSVTTDTSSIEYVITPGVAITGLAMFSLLGSSYQIVMNDPVDGEVYNTTGTLIDTSSVFDWATYFFEEFRTIENIVEVDLPPYNNAVITVTITGTSTVQVGELVIGTLVPLGITQYAPEVGIIDYSRKGVDDYGNFSVTERAFSKKTNFRVVMDNALINIVNRTLSEIRAVPVVWVATDNPLYESTLVTYGFYKDFRIIIPHPIWAELSLQIEGLI